MSVTEFRTQGNDESLIKRWSTGDGLVELREDGENSYRAVVQEGKATINVDTKWISGLPEKSLELNSIGKEAFFSNTHVVVHPWDKSLRQIEIRHDVLGGMMRLSDFEPRRKLWSLSQAIQNTRSRVISFSPLPIDARMRERDDKKFKILSIDGGGIRGIIPLKILSALEKMTGPIHETFDFIGGTSTGGIIALGLTAPYKDNRVDGILRLYQQEAHRIFKRNPYKHIHDLTAKIARRLVCKCIEYDSLRKAIVDHPLYSAQGIQNVAHEYIGESLMKDAKTNVLITAVDVTDPQKPMNADITNLEEKYALMAMMDVARATSAAPIYFPQAQIHMNKYIDGGVCNNNPGMRCHLYANRQGIPLANQYIVSLGTGFADIEGLEGGGSHNLLYWAKNLYPINSTALSRTINDDLGSVLQNRFHRLDPHLKEEIDLDDICPVTLKKLSDIGDELVEVKCEEIREIAKDLNPESI